MKRAVLIFNPQAGVGRGKRLRELEYIRAIFHAGGVETTMTTTLGPKADGDNVLHHVEGDFDAVIACGGDGTVNEVLQALMQNGHRAALGIVPQGSGNLLARELGIPRSAEASARAILRADRVGLPVPCIETFGAAPRRRYWLVAAGIGADARVICAIDPSKKARFGIAAYYAEALRQLVFTRDLFTPFLAHWRDADGTSKSEIVTQVVVERIGYFGPCVESQGTRKLGPGEMRALLFKSGRRGDYLSYGARLVAHQLSGQSGRMRSVEVIRTREINCQPMPNAKYQREVLAEVDGELLGSLPVRVFLTDRNIEFLLPSR